jgi:hypothetical protein
MRDSSSRAFISVANLCCDPGFKRFQKQKGFKVSGFYFMTPDMAEKIIAEAGFEIEKCSLDPQYKQEGDNLYY